MNQSDIDIGTKVKRHGYSAVVIYNRCRIGKEAVAIELDDDHSVVVVHMSELEIKYGGEEWVSVKDMMEKRSK